MNLLQMCYNGNSIYSEGRTAAFSPSGTCKNIPRKEFLL